jgi:hypothetical protein
VGGGIWDRWLVGGYEDRSGRKGDGLGVGGMESGNMSAFFLFCLSCFLSMQCNTHTVQDEACQSINAQKTPPLVSFCPQHADAMPTLIQPVHLAYLFIYCVCASVSLTVALTASATY